MSVYRLRETPLRGEIEWALEDGDLVRRAGRRETRWPLATLRRLTLSRQRNRYGPDQWLARLRFGRRSVGLTSQGWRGIGRSEDRTHDFTAFVRALAVQAARLAPAARFEIGGTVSTTGLWWIAGLLGAGVAALIAMSIAAGMTAMGVNLAARLLFVLILLFAVAPWLPGRASRGFDPLALPDDLGLR